ncbi:phenylalanine--tRNA ligase subunit beta, partial [Candidatus Saccharibacteria bacterium]|nr:phenylalanine--tRNA ligase subunit beta [Candidatus Saccharibacteria bacterium]
LEVTFNRGDLLSILGVARELAALYNLKLEGEEEVFKPQAALKSLTLQSTKELSPLYTLCLIEALSYQETPPQIRKRLELAGMRSVNLFADITNYVMLEYGQPLHAFDAEKVRERNKDLTIKVRNAKRGEKIKTLDGLTRNLESSDIVIADRKGPIAIAGIMGGEETEVDLNTKEILLEAAIFNPISIRRTARRLGLQSEASTRFEHYLSPENLLAALTKASKLYQLHGGGKVVGFGQEGKTRTKKEAVNLNKARLDALLGAKINFAKARKYLARLGFKVMSSDKGLVAWPPHFRGDITCEEDLIEEVARMEGYETLPATPPATGAIEIPQNNFEHLRQYLSELLVGLGFYEVRSYPFLNTEALTHRGTEKLRKIKNPISVETEYLKDSSLLNLLAIA